jgi:hypothetical protein
MRKMVILKIFRLIEGARRSNVESIFNFECLKNKHFRSFFETDGKGRKNKVSKRKASPVKHIELMLFRFQPMPFPISFNVLPSSSHCRYIQENVI